MIIKVSFYLNKASVRLTDGKLTGFCDTAFLTGFHNYSVYNNFYVMLKGLLQFDLVFTEDLNLSVHSYPGESFTLDAVQDLLMGAFLGTDHRCQDQELGPLIHGHDRIHHLVHRLGGNGLPAYRAVRLAYSCKEKSEIVVYLSHGTHSGPGVSVGCLLVDGNSRAQALDVFNIRLFHLSQELTGIRREGLHIPPLSLSINGIKSKG